MSPPRIMVVEDEGIVARDLQNRLERMGYVVCAVASSGDEAIQKAGEARPDLMLMDIVLKGRMDGIEAADTIRRRFGTPAIYLTAYADEGTLQRAKVTGPHGYILKPFSERELRTNIEVALYRSEMERKLHSVAQWFSSTVRSIDEGVIATDAEGRVTFMSDVAERLAGKTKEQALGGDVDDLVHLIDAETRERLPSPVRAVLSEGVFLHRGDSSLLVTQAGAELPVDTCAAATRAEDGQGVRGAVLVLRDVSRRRETEAELRARSRQQAVVTDLSQRALAQADIAELLQEAVTAIAGTLDVEHCSVQEQLPERGGYVLRAGFGLPDGWIGQTVSAGPGMPAAHTVISSGPLLVPELRTPGHLVGAAPPHTGEVQSALLAPIVGKGKEVPWGVVAVHSDRPRHFDQDDVNFVESVANLLATAVQRWQMEQELRLRAEQLAEADRRKDQFLAILAHELRNPLSPMQSVIEIMRLSDVPDPSVHGALDVLDRQVQKMRRLVDDLLDVSRITRDKIHMQLQPLEVSAVIAAGVQSCKPLLEARRHRLTVSLPGDPLWVRGDPTRLEQILENVLNNAAKYTDPGGRIAITLEREDASAPGGGAEVVLRVQDNGVGASPAMLPRLFELFIQADHSLDRAQQGLGIGLSLVRNLVQMHGGTVSLHSEGIGRGMEVVIRLPALPPASGSQPVPPSVTKGAPRQSLRILIVDDNADSAEMLATLLRLWGYTSEVARSGPQGIELASASRPDVVLLDIGMPGMDGYEVAKRLRQLDSPEPVGGGSEDPAREAPGELAQRMTLVALTGYGQEDDRRRSKAAGFDHHLTKPVDREALRRLLRERSGRAENPGA